MESVWSHSPQLPAFPTFKGHAKTDVLIIGGGITGVLCAHRLTEQGISCILLEGSQICSGITKNTTAKITSQHGLIYQKLLRNFGAETARLYFQANQEAVNTYRTLCGKINCKLETMSSFLYDLESIQNLEQELSALEKIGYTAKFRTELPLPLNIKGAIEFENQAQVHPLEFVSKISSSLPLYEHSFVKKLSGTTAYTDQGSVAAKHVIVATHFPFLNQHGSYFLKLYQSRSYVSAYDCAPDVNGMYVDAAEGGLSFRNYDRYLLIGGGGHRTGKPGSAWQSITQFARQHYPNAAETYRWATQDCITLDHIPYIGKYSQNTDNIYVATGFNKWGMTSAMIAANLLTDLICGKENPYSSVFSPSRSILHPQLLQNLYESLIGIANFSAKRCPHMGCKLVWNAQEHSWDCPCHGSRFSQSGELIDNPAKKGLHGS